MAESLRCKSQNHHRKSKEKGGSFEAKLATDDPLQLRCHKICGASYTSKEHRGREVSKKRKTLSEHPQCGGGHKSRNSTLYVYKRYCTINIRAIVENWVVNR